MNQDLEVLLALQAADADVDALAARDRELAQRIAELDREREAAAGAARQARAVYDTEAQREREMQRAAQEHRELHDRFYAQMDVVRKPKEAEAAMSQLQMAQKVVADDESRLREMRARLDDLQQSAEAHDAEVGEVEGRQQEARTEVEEQRQALRAEITAAQAKRAERAKLVPRTLLGRYEKLRTRARGTVLTPLDGMACGNCRTAIPMQRRNEILAGRRIEPCEGCGTLLYASG